MAMLTPISSRATPVFRRWAGERGTLSVPEPRAAPSARKNNRTVRVIFFFTRVSCRSERVAHADADLGRQPVQPDGKGVLLDLLQKDHGGESGPQQQPSPRLLVTVAGHEIHGQQAEA